MPLAIPPELKKINPYVRRAEELDKDRSSPESRLVAYYCRQYAVHEGIPLAQQSAAAKTVLGHLLGNLEQEKPAMDAFSREEAYFLCRKFAQRVFDKADGEDRMEMAGKNTARTFYAASNFLQILEQFKTDENSEDFVEDRKKIIYAKWKATDILKAIKEGREPTPGGYGEPGMMDLVDDEDEENGGGKKEETTDLPVAPPNEPPKRKDAPAVSTVQDDSDDGEEISGPLPPRLPMKPPAQPPQQRPPQQQQPPPAVESDDDEEEQGTEVALEPPPPAYPGPSTSFNSNPEPPSTSRRTDRPPLTFHIPPAPQEAPKFVPQAPSSPPAAAKKNGGFFGFGGGGSNKKSGKITKDQLNDAIELTRFALAALEDKDGELAAERLQQALETLGR